MDYVTFDVGFQYILDPFLFHPAKALLKILKILFKIVSVHCVSIAAQDERNPNGNISLELYCSIQKVFH